MSKPEKKKRQAPYKSSARGTNWKERFIAEYELCGNVREASKRSGVDWRTVHKHKHSDAEFAALCKKAKEIGHATRIEEAEEELLRRAMDKNHHSDAPLFFFLKAALPEKYRDNAKVEIIGAVEHTHVHEVYQRLMRDPAAFAAAKQIRDRLGKLLESNVDPAATVSDPDIIDVDAGSADISGGADHSSNGNGHLSSNGNGHADAD